MENYTEIDLAIYNLSLKLSKDLDKCILVVSDIYDDTETPISLQLGLALILESKVLWKQEADNAQLNGWLELERKLRDKIYYLTDIGIVLNVKIKELLDEQKS